MTNGLMKFEALAELAILAGMSKREVRDRMDRAMIRMALVRTHGHVGKAATLLRVHRNSLARSMYEWRILAKEYRMIQEAVNGDGSTRAANGDART